MDMEKPTERIDDIKKAEAMAHAKNEAMKSSPQSPVVGEVMEKYTGMEHDAMERIKDMSPEQLNEEGLKATAMNNAINKLLEERGGNKSSNEKGQK